MTSLTPWSWRSERPRPNDFFAQDAEGGSLKGIHFAMEFLHANTKSLLDSNLAGWKVHSRPRGSTSSSSAGGDTGNDCLRNVGFRHGCQEPRATSKSCRSRRRPRRRTTCGCSGREVYRPDYGHTEAAAKFDYSKVPGKTLRGIRGNTRSRRPSSVGDGPETSRRSRPSGLDWTKPCQWAPRSRRSPDRSRSGRRSLLLPGPSVSAVRSRSSRSNFGLEKDQRSNFKADYWQVRDEHSGRRLPPGTAAAARARSSGGDQRRSRGGRASATAT